MRRRAPGPLRHLLAILLLPMMVLVVMPWWLIRTDMSLPRMLLLSPAVGLALVCAGALAVLAGLVLFAWCVTLFARVGRGTLAPWDPTHRLILVGPYRHVRNPMIVAVASILAGEALLLQSPRLAAWFAVFVAINHVHFLRVEEPGLRRRFGAEYERYARAVPRWVPRWRA